MARAAVGRVGWPPGTRAALIGAKVLPTIGPLRNSTLAPPATPA